MVFFSVVVDVCGPTALVIDRPRNRLLVANRSANNIYSLNLEGKPNPRVLTRYVHDDDTQPPMTSPIGIALDPEDPDRAFVVGMSSKNLIAVDLITGRRKIGRASCRERVVVCV